MELKNGMFVIPPCNSLNPDGTKNLTKNKMYEVFNVSKILGQIGYCFSITDNDGETLFCLLNGCSHIDYKNWKVKEDKI